MEEEKVEEQPEEQPEENNSDTGTAYVNNNQNGMGNIVAPQP